MGYRPSPAHLLILRAALAPADSAIDAWSAWRAEHRVVDAGVDESRVLPIIAARLAEALPHDAELARLRSHRRQIWAANAVRAARSAEVAQSLRSVGIESLFFKGIGVLPFYGDPTARRMLDADMLVHWHQRHDAIDHVVSLGFRPLYGTSIDDMHGLDLILPGYGLSTADGVELDLHWRPLHHLRNRPHLDQVLFDRARPVSAGATEIAVPDPSHQLVLVLGHGLRATSGAHLISLVDAVQLLRAPDFEIARTVELARSYERTSTVSSACDALVEVLRTGGTEHDVAVERIESLRRGMRRPTIGDRLLERRLSALDPAAEHRAESIRRTWIAVSETPLRDGGPVFGLAELVRRQLGLRRASDVPAHLVWLAGSRSAKVGRFRVDREGGSDHRPRLRIGDHVDVSTTASVTDLLEFGWWAKERAHIWSRGPESVISFDLTLGRGQSCNLAIRSMPFLNSVSRSMSVDARINGRSRATWRYEFGSAVETTQRITVNETELDSGRCSVMFIVVGSSSPSAGGDSIDERVLGIGFFGIAVEEVGRELVPSSTTLRWDLRADVVG